MVELKVVLMVYRLVDLKVALMVDPKDLLDLMMVELKVALMVYRLVDSMGVLKVG